MLPEETAPNERRRSLTFADKFEVKFFFKAEAPREVAFCETSFTDSYYEDDDYWDPEDSYDEEDYYEEYDDYDDYDDEEGQDMYHQHYSNNEYDDYYHDDYDDYYNNGTNFSLRYAPEETYDHHEEEERSFRRELFSVFSNDEDTNGQNASERSTTRRLALAKLEKGLFRRQQQRDSETFSETEESEASNSNSESDPFDEPLPPSRNSSEFLDDIKRSNSPVSIKATFTTRELPISVQIPNHNVYKLRNHDNEMGSPSLDHWKKRGFSFMDFSDRMRPSSPSIFDGDENPYSLLDDTLLSCTPLTVINKSNSPSLVLNLSSKKDVKELLKTSISSPTTTSVNSKTKSVDVKYVPTINSNDLVKSMANNNILSNSKASKETVKAANTINHLLSNIHNNTNSKGANNKSVKKRSRSYSSPSSFQHLFPCY